MNLHDHFLAWVADVEKFLGPLEDRAKAEFQKLFHHHVQAAVNAAVVSGAIDVSGKIAPAFVAASSVQPGTPDHGNQSTSQPAA